MTTTTASASAATTTVRLSDLGDADKRQRFDDLQARMGSVWDAMQHDHEGESVVVVPSVALDPTIPDRGTLVQAFEERFLFLLLLLRQPRLRMVYVTSRPINPAVIEYYLALLPGVIPSHARARLTLISADDASARPLSVKLLSRPRLLAKIAAQIPNRAMSHLIPYNTSSLEEDIALTLGIPMYAADPKFAGLGSKSGCRRLFAEEGIVHPLGVENLNSLDEVVESIVSMLAVRTDMAQVIVKLNDGVAGAGNATVDLRGIETSTEVGKRSAVTDRVRAMQLESESTSFEEYWARFEQFGGIVEERILGEKLVSPSVQLRARPDGSVELLSTHDQLLGGASGQRFLGCVFPADPGYSRLITEPALVIGRRLAREGVLGRFAVDFVAAQTPEGAWSVYAIELNLRKGGTTHPFLTLQYLTAGAYDADSGQFLTPAGRPKHLVATDHLESEDLRALSVGDLFDTVARHELHFDQSTRTGIVFHMISCLSEFGRVGMTAVGDSAEGAMELYERAGRILLEEAAQARREQALPD